MKDKRHNGTGTITHTGRPKGWRARGPNDGGKAKTVGYFCTREEAELALGAHLDLLAAQDGEP